MRRGSYDDAAASLRPHLQNLAQRRRSAPSLPFSWALGRTWAPIREEGFCQVAVDQCPFVLGLTNENAELTLDERVQLTEGLKTREHQLFLFSDILVIAKLNSPEVKERWLDTLHRKIKEAKKRAGSVSPPPSVLMTVLSGSVACKTPGGGMDSVIELPTDGKAPPPLKVELLCNTQDRACHPIENAGSRRWSLFQKKPRKSSSHSGTAPCSDSSPKNLLFGQPLCKVCPEDGKLPKPITDMLTLLLKKGTFTEGVFRKGPSARSMKEVREQLNSGAPVDMGSKPVTLLAALFKDFLRQLPGCLLVAEEYGDWMIALETEDIQERHAQLRQVIDRLPPANGVLLQHLLCVLHHISRNAATNKMDARNLAICIAPNLLDHSLDTETVNKVTDLTQFLIENCCQIFGEQIQSLLGDPDEEELVDNLDSLSSHQHDSAYDSTDPDAEGDLGDPTAREPLGPGVSGEEEEEEDGPPPVRLPGRWADAHH
ncbi:hypothetical protein SKAU_G00183840 [Synaphobranchus kaupii]|uniref:Rho-GAP domain-containing protein n=1 Tax=Synaphobranchus kaupii TaxID=118154 RepID=A0A9Q1FC40_SYNKA|nr:hypothetical protein SKAU_G00183840 [Synaphobranchus kaupii]